MSDILVWTSKIWLPSNLSYLKFLTLSNLKFLNLSNFKFRQIHIWIDFFHDCNWDNVLSVSMSMAQKFLSCEINSCSSKTGKYPGTRYVFGTNLFSLTNMYCMFLYLDCILCQIFFLKCMQIHGVVLCGFSHILFGCSRDSTRARAGCSQLRAIFFSAAAVTKQGLEPAAVSFESYFSRLQPWLNKG